LRLEVHAQVKAGASEKDALNGFAQKVMEVSTDKPDIYKSSLNGCFFMSKN
jgi:hypothetical protein